MKPLVAVRNGLMIQCACGAPPWLLANLVDGAWRMLPTEGLDVWLEEHAWHGEHEHEFWGEDPAFAVNFVTSAEESGRPVHESLRCAVCWHHAWHRVWWSIMRGIAYVAEHLDTPEPFPQRQPELFPPGIRVGARPPGARS